MVGRQRRPRLASLSLDLDNLWSYLMIRGDPSWQNFPSFLSLVIPRVLDFLEKRRLRITFFIVGQDAVREENLDWLRAIAEAGHELGNHSFHHWSWLSSLSAEEIETEIVRAEEAIEAVAGRPPVGFRGPGYAHSAPMWEVLARRGYRYDASTLPTFIGPLARAFYFRRADLDRADRLRRRDLFGDWRDGLRPLKPHWIDCGGRRILEIPVTTLPLFRLPIHVSYVLYLARFSRRLARLYAHTAARLCEARRLEPSLLLHPLDFLGGDEVPALRFFPAMDQPAGRKIEITSEVLEVFGSAFRWVPLEEHAGRLLAEPCLPTRKIEPTKRTN
jgi:hypothetical protein